MASKNRIKRSNLPVKNLVDFLLPFSLVFGLCIVLHGHLTPGGGFQGGVLVASSVVLLFLGYGWDATSRTIRMDFLKKNEACVAILYVLLALAGIFAGTVFCRNIFYDIGPIGALLSSGNIAFMNLAVGYKVMTGVGFLLLLMLGLLAEKDEADDSLVDEEEEEDGLDDHC